MFDNMWARIGWIALCQLADILTTITYFGWLNKTYPKIDITNYEMSPLYCAFWRKFGFEQGTKLVLPLVIILNICMLILVSGWRDLSLVLSGMYIIVLLGNLHVLKDVRKGRIPTHENYIAKHGIRAFHGNKSNDNKGGN